MVPPSPRRWSARPEPPHGDEDTAMAAQRIQTYAEFWPFYQREHLRPLTRWLHFAGTTAGLVCLGIGLVAGSPWWVVGSLIAGYGAAWVAHAFVERNKPATFTYPLWSLRADFHMYALMWLGRMPPPPVSRES